MTVKVESVAAPTPSSTERVRRMLTLKNLHIAGVTVLAGVCLYLLGQMLYAWRSAKSQDASALAQQGVAMQAAEVAARPLAGLDDKLKQATVDANKFYERRLPYSYSEVAGELGVLKNKAGVKLTRGQYNEAAGVGGWHCSADRSAGGCEPERGLSTDCPLHQFVGAGQDIFPDTECGIGWAAGRVGGSAAGVDDVSAGSGWRGVE